MIMIDNGSTHSFFNPLIVTELSLPTSSCPTLNVATTSDTNLNTAKLCVGLNFFIQGHLFQADLRVLHVPGYDIILGIDWLSMNSPVKVN
jgi:Retroviral aspartyl protease